jgi:dTMP kinase
LFITFEGPDGSGKSTQIRLLAEYLTKLGMKCVVTREPGGTEIGEKVRAILKDNSLNGILSVETEVLLFQVARAQHVHELIIPALKRGEVVLCDRFADSSVAYQGAGRGVGENRIKALNRFSTRGVIPGLTILLDIPAMEGLKRAAFRHEEADRWELEKAAFHEKVRNAFLTLAKQNRKRFKIVSVYNKTVEDVHKEIVEHVVSWGIGIRDQGTKKKV